MDIEKLGTSRSKLVAQVDACTSMARLRNLVPEAQKLKDKVHEKAEE